MINNIETNWEKQHKRQPSHTVVKAFVKPKLVMIDEIINIKKDWKILDVGCGNGWFTYYLNEYSRKVEGIDISKYMIKNNPCKNVRYGDAEDINSSSNKYDLVFSSNLFHHLDNPIKAFNEFVRVSKKWIVLSEPNHNSMLVKLFSFINKYEREIPKLEDLYNYIHKLNVKIVKQFNQGFVTPASTPVWLLDLMLLFDDPTDYSTWKITIIKK